VVTAAVAAAPGMLHPQTRAWAVQHSARIIDLAADHESYWRLLAAEWARPEDLLLVEHDMLPAPGVTESMTACPRPWCTSPYRIEHSWLDDGLGCVKLAARLKQRHPDLMTRLGEISDGSPAKDWHRLDTRLSALLRGHGYRPHPHRRSEHLHNYGRRP
jgi:hypothetical protein